MLAEDGCDLTWFDPVAANLHLLIDPPEKCDLTVGQPARQISRAVKASARFRAEGIRNEPFRSQLRAVFVPAGQARAANIDFSRAALRYKLATFVQNVNLDPINRTADGGRLVCRAISRNHTRSADHRAFGWAVVIHQNERQPLRRIFLQRVRPGEQESQRRRFRPLQLHDRFRHRRGRESDRDVPLDQPVAQPFCVASYSLLREM